MIYRAGFAAIISVGLLLQGCFGLVHSVVSKPTVSEEAGQHVGRYGFTRLNQIQLVFPDATITVQSLNRLDRLVSIGPLLPIVPWPPGLIGLMIPYPQKPPLWIGIQVVPKKADIVINPDTIQLLTQTGDIIKPRVWSYEAPRYLAPRLCVKQPGLWASMAGVVRGYRPLTFPLLGKLQPLEKPITITRPNCIWLEFAVSPDPDQLFVLLLEGMEINRQVSSIPPVSFTKESGIGLVFLGVPVPTGGVR